MPAVVAAAAARAGVCGVLSGALAYSARTPAGIRQGAGSIEEQLRSSDAQLAQPCVKRARQIGSPCATLTLAQFSAQGTMRTILRGWVLSPAS